MRQDMNMDEIMEYQGVFISCPGKKSKKKQKNFWISADFFLFENVRYVSFQEE